MGDRASVSFKNGKKHSVALFDHWGGEEMAQIAKGFAEEFKQQYPAGGNSSTPFTRLEPNTVMVQFILSYQGAKDNHSVYLGADELSGDCSDNGHTIIDLETI